MPKVNVTDLQGMVRALEFEAGDILMELLRDNDYEEIQALCGGSCSCATCHVHIDPEQHSLLAEIEEDEQILVEYADAYDQSRSRLSCQIELDQQHDGLNVTIVDTF